MRLLPAPVDIVQRSYLLSGARRRVAAQLLPTLPVVGQLQSTAIRTVGTYSNWLSKNPQLLPPLLTFVSNGLRLEATAAAASQAMKLLCDSCAEHLAEPNTMQQLLQMYLGTLQLPLAVADRVDLVAALAFVVSQMELEQILPAMQAIAQPLLERLTVLLGGVVVLHHRRARHAEQLQG